MTVLPQKASLDVVPSAGWNAILDKIQNGTDLDVLLGRIAKDLRIVVPTSGSGTDADPYPAADIQATISSLPAAPVGGKVLVPSGIWDLDALLTVDRPVILEGQGRDNTTLRQTAVADGIDLSDWGVLKDFRLEVPAARVGHGIVTRKAADGFRIEHLDIDGIDSTKYGVRVEDAFRFSIRDVVMNTRGGGLHLINTDDLLNYGNAVVENVFVTMNGPGNSTYGLNVEGAASKNYNLMTFNYFSAQTGAAHPNTMTGVRLANAARCLFLLPNIEGTDKGFIFGTPSGDSVLLQPFIGDTTNPFDFQTSARRVLVLGGESGGTVLQSSPFRLRDLSDFIGVRNHRFSRFRQRAFFFDDFMGDALDARWNVATGTWAMQNIAHGAVRGTTGASIGNPAKLDWGTSLHIKREYDFEVEVRFAMNIGNLRDTFIGISDGGTVAGNHGAYLEVLNADSNFFFASSDGATKSRTDSGSAKSAAQRILNIQAGRTFGDVRFTLFDIDYGELASVSKTTNLPGMTTQMGPHLEVVTQTAAIRELDIDYFLLEQGRR